MKPISIAMSISQPDAKMTCDKYSRSGVMVIRSEFELENFIKRIEKIIKEKVELYQSERND